MGPTIRPIPIPATQSQVRSGAQTAIAVASISVISVNMMVFFPPIFSSRKPNANAPVSLENA